MKKKQPRSENNLSTERTQESRRHIMLEQTEEVNAGDWKEQILGANKLVVVQFWHPHCPHCQAIKPVYNELAGEYGDKLKFTKLNVVDSTENE
jgi:thiol-disulfide isomerase/thioredoxin